MGIELVEIFESIRAPAIEVPAKPVYAVIPVPGSTSYFLGKDAEALPCLLVATVDKPGRLQPPIRLESLDVQFDLACHVRKERAVDQQGTFTVIRCRSHDLETVRYFLSVCETILRILGDDPTRAGLSSVVQRLAAIFQKMQKAPTRSIDGLIGELYFLWRSANPVRALNAWRTDENARFDFSDGDVRIDVKATGRRSRVHTFSYDQCNPPPGTLAIVASLFIERAANGMTLQSLLGEIERMATAQADLVFKLHEVAVGTLGASLNESLSQRFDVRLADSSLSLFDLRDVPAIRGPLPVGVSDVHFRSDLSPLRALSIQALIDRDPVFWDLLPRTEDA